MIKLIFFLNVPLEIWSEEVSVRIGDDVGGFPTAVGMSSHVDNIGLQMGWKFERENERKAKKMN